MFELRPYQEQALERIYTYFERETGNPLIVIPTGGGKSLVIASFVKAALEGAPDTRILILTHVKELIEQNFQEMISLWPICPAGIYSAGVGRRDIRAQVLFGGIQSLHKKALQVGQVDLILVDEAHLIPKKADTMYGRFLNDLKKVNPWAKVIGFTATPYRTDSGLLHEGPVRLFTDIAFEVGIRELIENDWLSPLISKPVDTQIDVSEVGTRGGDYIAGQLEAAVDQEHITKAAVAEMVEYGQDREGWLAFCSGVNHAEHVRDEIRAHGISCETVTGETPKADRRAIIAAFKRKEIRCLTNANVLTTGFNAKHVDLIAMLRPTQSTGLYIQIAGRGTRKSPGKSNCLVLDFAGNISRHGPIDKVRPPRTKHKDGAGEMPVKVCPVEGCGHENFIAAKFCARCDYEFPPPEVKIDATAATEAIYGAETVQWLDVKEVVYARHEKEGKPDSLRVDYVLGLQSVSEWVCLEHEGFARRKAVQWWNRRDTFKSVPDSVARALEESSALRQPYQIAIRKNGKFTEVVGAKFQEEEVGQAIGTGQKHELVSSGDVPF